MRKTFIPQDADQMTDDQKNAALESLMFPKEKRDGSIKGRACADGRKQRNNRCKGRSIPDSSA